MLTVLHLSDLHRSQDAPVSNDLLLSCLLLDLEKHQAENLPIHKCDVAIVTGDLVRGASIDEVNVSETLNKQYKEAKSFLIRLSQKLFEGDLRRIFLMPGNHDVCWQLCQQSMETVEEDGRMDIPDLLEGVNSPYRWSWKDRCLYRIRDFEVYRSRFKHFKEFFDDLYEEQGYEFSLEDNEQAVNFVTPDGKALITGFSSLYGNDCYDRRGRISADNVARNGLRLRELGLDGIPLKIAFWHHSLETSEFGVDHLNRSEVLPLLIDRGYILGLHGHQHKSGIMTFAYHLDPKRVMPIISCGSVCANPQAIPPGYRRQYNIIEVDEKKCSMKVHVREWFGNTSFTAAKLQEFGGRSWSEVGLPLLQDKAQDQTQVSNELSRSFDSAELYMREQQFEKAYPLLKGLPQNVPIVRKLLIETLHALGRWNELTETIQEPTNQYELGVVVDALCKQGNPDRADQIVTQCQTDVLTYERGFLDNLKKRIQAEKVVLGEGKVRE